MLVSLLRTVVSTVLLVLLSSLAAAAVETAASGNKLRGSAVVHSEDNLYGQTGVELKEQEVSLLKSLSKITQYNYEHGRVGKEVEKGPAYREYAGGNPNLDFSSYLVSRRFTERDCTGEVKSVVGHSLSCVNLGGNMSTSTDCSSGRGATLTSYLYASSDCSGLPVDSHIMDESMLETCNNGEKMFCVQEDRKSSPVFAQKEGLVTYKFDSWATCVNFAESYLNYSPDTIDDDLETVYIDDYVPHDKEMCCLAAESVLGCPFPLCQDQACCNGLDPNCPYAPCIDPGRCCRGGDISYGCPLPLCNGLLCCSNEGKSQGGCTYPICEGQPCCSLLDISNGCPFPLCQSSDDDEYGGELLPPPSGPSRRLKGNPTSATSSPAVKGEKWWEHETAASATGTDAGGRPYAVQKPNVERWWENPTVKPRYSAGSDTSMIQVHEAIQTDEKRVDTVSTGESPHEVMMLSEDNREYAFSQLRNGVCTFDPKYQLWVKTSCHGFARRISYYLFADKHCRRPIQRVGHKLDQFVPHYGDCVGSRQNDGRYALTVCHNNDQPNVELGDK